MKNLFLSLLSGLLMAFAWPSIGFAPLIFIAFIPLFCLENNVKNIKELFIYSIITFLVFNCITTYWVYYSTSIGSYVAFLLNSILMTLPIVMFSYIKKITNSRFGFIVFILGWISFEYFHLNWDLSWPWLTIGNVFADFPYLIQWYEYTGFLGGSLWVLLVNTLFFISYKNRFRKKFLIYTSSFFFIPIIISFYLYSNTSYLNNQYLNILIIQPNIDAYKKYNQDPYLNLNKFISQVKSDMRKDIDLVVGPETALTFSISEHKLESHPSIIQLRKMQQEFNRLNILIGATTWRKLDQKEVSETSRYDRKSKTYYEMYNSVLFIPKYGKVRVYHKSRLVPGVEKMPFPKILDPIAELIVDLGGTSGSLGSDNKSNLFKIKNGISIAPLVCYESVYGELDISNSNLIAVLTNDGWWKNTAGYKQHFSYSKIRAIENRKFVVRSANTGISGIIDFKGNAQTFTKWNEKTNIISKVFLNKEKTFYSKFGDYIGRISTFLYVILILTVIVKRKTKLP